MEDEKEVAIYQTENGSIELKADSSEETIWASVKQIAQIFDIDRSVVSRHIKNIFSDDELDKKVVCAKFAHTTQHGSIKGKNQTRLLDYYGLDIILAVGYRTNSTNAIKFRKWATQTLKQHITQGYTLNKKVLDQNKELFLNTLNDLKILTQKNMNIETKDVLSLIQSFSATFFNLESYDKNNFPKHGTLNEVTASAQELYDDLHKLKQELIKKSEATKLFAQEKQKDKLKGIFGNIFQTVFGQDAYPSIEEKAAHLLYFVIKNHPFNDGNKRSGAFAFIWFLQKVGYEFATKITPETLTALTLLIAESNPLDKDKMIGIVLLLLNTEH